MEKIKDAFLIILLVAVAVMGYRTQANQNTAQKNMEDQDKIELQNQITELRQRLDELPEPQERDQLTYPLDERSIQTLSQTVDLFLLDKITDLVWNKFFHYLTTFESLDGFTLTSAVQVTVDGQNVAVATTNVANNAQGITKQLAWNPFLSFRVPAYFRTTIVLDSVADVKGEIVIGSTTSDGSGDYTQNNTKYGFRIVNDKLYGITDDATTRKDVELATIGANTAYNLTAKYYPRKQVVFYVNGVEKGSAIVNLPIVDDSSSTAETNFFEASLTTNAAAIKTLKLSLLEYIQFRVNPNKQ